MRGFLFLGVPMDTTTIALAFFVFSAGVILAIGVMLERRQRKREQEALEAMLQRERERIAARFANVTRTGPPIRPVQHAASERRSSVRAYSPDPSPSPSPAPPPDYLAQHLIWQHQSTPAPTPSPSPSPSFESSCRADSYRSGGGGDFGGAGASSSWDSGSSSDSSSSSSSDSSSYSSSD